MKNLSLLVRTRYGVAAGCALLFIVAPFSSVSIRAEVGQEAKPAKAEITIAGQIRRGGQREWKSNYTVAEAISDEGGFTDGARIDAVTVTRLNGREATTFVIDCRGASDGKKNGKQSAAFVLAAGDIIWVPSYQDSDEAGHSAAKGSAPHP